MSIVVSISPKAEMSLRQLAAANGKELSCYASEILEQVATAEKGVPEQMDFEKWSSRAQALVAKMREYATRRPADFALDDSRESIYSGRGE